MRWNKPRQRNAYLGESIRRMILPAAVAGTMVSGCVPYHDVGTAIATYQATPACCVSFDAIAFEKLSAGRSETFGLNQASPAFMFDGFGKSYFKAFELPNSTKQGNFVVRSDTFQNGYPSKGIAVFFPAVTFLDSGKKIVSVLDWSATKKELLQENGGPAYVEVSTNLARIPGARYAIVHTNAAFLGHSQSLHYHVLAPSPAVGALLGLTGGEDELPDVTAATDAPGNGLEIEVD